MDQFGCKHVKGILLFKEAEEEENLACNRGVHAPVTRLTASGGYGTAKPFKTNSFFLFVNLIF